LGLRFLPLRKSKASVEQVEDRFPLAILGQIKGSLLDLVVVVGRYAESVKHGGVEIGYSDGVLGYQ
jgi:hypothetical protein